MSDAPRTAASRARPVPNPGVVKVCCADLWCHPGVRVLVGDHLHPGGRRLTERALDLLALPRGATLLDVGTGPGAGARIAEERGVSVVALDLSAIAAADAAGAPGVAAMAADAERLPLIDAAVDGVLVECVLSAIPDKGAAAGQIHRVLRDGGALLLSDVTRRGALPPEFDTVMGWVACAAGALPVEGYVRLLESAGLTVEHVEDRRQDLVDLVAQVRRRLALLQGALAAGVVDRSQLEFPAELLDLGQRLLHLASDAASDGRLSYGLFVARR